MTPFDPNESVSVTLAAADWNTVLAALSEIPYRVAAPVVERIMAQVREHQEQPAPVKANGSAQPHTEA